MTPPPPCLQSKGYLDIWFVELVMKIKAKMFGPLGRKEVVG